MEEKFSKDPKVILKDEDEFLKETFYLSDAEGHQWEGNRRPKVGEQLIHITPFYLIYISYSAKSINFGMDFTEMLDYIVVSKRDYEHERIYFDSRINMVKSLVDSGESKLEDAKPLLEKLYNGKNILEQIRKKFIEVPTAKNFESYLLDIDYETVDKNLADQYVVLDVETNGTRKANDDLLSISIYDPLKKKCYNRFLPLDLQPLVLTGWVNGIKDEDLEGATHLTQQEVNQIIDFFDLKNKTILSYSGGKGEFDKTFIINYCKRHNLTGFEDLKYENIKTLVPTTSVFYGDMTKDNLCKLFKIDGVTDIHTGTNDCLLEWRLFEKVKRDNYFFIRNVLFRFNKNYIIPVTYLMAEPMLKKFAGVEIPNIAAFTHLIFEYALPSQFVKLAKKFPNNITGMAVEHGLNSALNVIEKKDMAFYYANKSNLEYIGKASKEEFEIPIITRPDGRMEAVRLQDKEFIEKVNESTINIIEGLDPVITFIRDKIFDGKVIFSHELVISEDRKVCAECDLSNDKSILEIKTFNVVTNESGQLPDKTTMQLYYQSKGRKAFILSIDFITHENRKHETITDAISIKIYEVTFGERKPEIIERDDRLTPLDKRILNTIKKAPNITFVELTNIFDCTKRGMDSNIGRLIYLGYLRKDVQGKKITWTILRDINDEVTKIRYVDGKREVLFDK